MANTLLTSSLILNEMLDELHNDLAFTANVNRQYDDSFKSYGAVGKPGESLKVRVPQQYTVRSGEAMSNQDVENRTVDITRADIRGVDISFSNKDLTTSIEEFSDTYIKPAMSTLASKIDRMGLEMYKSIYNSVGVPTNDLNTAKTYLQAGALLSNSATPLKQRSCIINPDAQAGTVDQLKGLFSASSKISDQYNTGQMGEALGFKFGMDQNVVSHTCGTRAISGESVMNGATSEGATTINIDGLTTGDTVLEGDILTIVGVYAVNPETKASTGALQQFTATATGTADGSGEIALAISPKIEASGSYQNVSALPADGAALVYLGAEGTSYDVNMAFHKDAMTLVTGDLELPRGVDFAARGKSDGISMRIVRDYTIASNQMPCRVDVFLGWNVLQARYATRIVGNVA